MKKLLILILALAAVLPAFAPSTSRAAAVVVEVGDRPYYRGPWYWGPHHVRYYWVPGHWGWRWHHRVWVRGHYVARY
jgi:hypothetical protein